MGDFLGALFGGSNPTLNSTINRAGDIATYGTSKGQGATNDSLDFYHALLSGNPELEAQVLAPEIKAGQDQAQQQKLGLAQFGNRSGGNTAAAAGIDSGLRGNLMQLLGQLKSNAAGASGNLGTSLLNLGLNANGQQAEQSQQRHQNWLNSILGGAITSGVNTGMGMIGL